MKYGLEIINTGTFSDARMLADLAQQAEEAGWDGFFLSDVMHDDARPVSDPWIALTAIAMQTKRMRIGPQVTPIPRRRPWKMARETVTLDHLSQGRLILGVGAGFEEDQGFPAFREEMDVKKRARMLDEGLEILQGLWSGKPFKYNGEHYHVDTITFLPPPIQTSSIPIWIGGRWPKKKSIERATRFDGVNLAAIRDGAIVTPTPEDIRQLKLLIDEQRKSARPFDIIASGVDVFGAHKNAQAQTTLKAYSDAGATWCLHRVWPEQNLDTTHKAILQGPPPLE